jgi:hypothetical protein
MQIMQRYKEEGFAINKVKAQVAQLFMTHEHLFAAKSNL